MRTSTRVIVILADIATVAAILVLWQLSSNAQATNTSRPVDVAISLAQWAVNPFFRMDIVSTLAEAGLGMLLGVLAAIILAAALASSRWLLDLLSPFITMLNAVPKIALAPLFLLLFGIQFPAKAYFVVATVIFIPFYSLVRGITTLDPTYSENLRTLGANRLWLGRDFYAPAIVGTVVASLRISAAFAIVSAIIAEFISSQQGIGFEINQAANNQQPALVMSGVLVATIIALIVDRLFWLLERRFESWKVQS